MRHFTPIPDLLTWKKLKEEHDLVSYSSWEKHLIENHGFEWITTAGRIGISGKKVHNLRVLCREVEITEWGKTTLTTQVADVRQTCGSAKWGSYVGVGFSEINREVDCSKCLKKK